jgi:hypothetical protein
MAGYLYNGGECEVDGTFFVEVMVGRGGIGVYRISMYDINFANIVGVLVDTFPQGELVSVVETHT